MSSKIKYLELTRHHLYKKSKSLLNKDSDLTGSEFNKLSEVFFSSALSLFLAYLAETYFKNAYIDKLHLWEIVLLFGSAIIVYCVLYLSIRKIYAALTKLIRHLKYKRLPSSPDASKERCKELVDDFDHIALDHLLISYELLDEIHKTGQIEERTFYFHEIIYYLQTSIRITQDLIHPSRIERCVNLCGKTDGVDVYRIMNACFMMDDIQKGLKSIIEDKNRSKQIIHLYSDKMAERLTVQINQIEESINSIREHCEQSEVKVGQVIDCDIDNDKDAK